MDGSHQFVALWSRVQPAVAGYISSLIPNFHEAEDVLQQVAVAALENFERYDPQLPFTAWAIGIARNKVLHHWRQSVRGRRFHERLVERITETYLQLADELDGEREALRECLRLVKGHARRALMMRYADNLMPAAIGEQLNVSPGAVRVLLHRTRAELNKCIRRRLNSRQETGND